MIGIIGAMSVEVKGFISEFEDLKVEKISGIEFYQGYISGKNVVAAVSGIGKVNAAICAQTMILKYAPSVIINTGVAGGLAQNLDIGDIVIGESVVQYDFDLSALGDPVGLIPGVDVINIPCSKILVEFFKNSQNVLENCKIHTGVIITADLFLNDTNRADVLAKQFGASANEMEGGSIGHVCYVNGVDFCAIRSISDKAGNSSDVEYNSFVESSAEKSIKLLLNYLKNA